jgi:peptidoglycan/LPS O-acetylase OafA/YrhL
MAATDHLPIIHAQARGPRHSDMKQPNALLSWLPAIGMARAIPWASLPTAGHDSAAHLKYRPDIDGLRAVAILPVLFFHLDIGLFSGGYVGVDVFFVISGYLIAGLISNEMAAGTYSVAKFYVRRARRIFPALFVMFAVTGVLVLLFCLPPDAERFRSSLLAATLFASNVYFYGTVDYFGPAPVSQPLVHTWSLGVEEQFYIVFPLVLWLLRRYLAVGEKAALLVLALVSLGVSAWLVETDLPAAFYLLHSRAWELLLGALLAIGTVPPVRSRLVAGLLGIPGLAMIVGSVLLYHEDMSFPGLLALPPCIGTALIIHTGRDSALMVTRLLSLPVARFIGLISYSLYLWHWPVIVIGRYIAYWNGWDPEREAHRLAVLAVTFACAVASWHFVEKPFRQKPYRFGSATVLSASAAAMAAFVIAASLFYPLSQRYWDLPGDVQRVLTVLNSGFKNGEYREKACFLTGETDDFRYFDPDGCLALSGTKKNWLLIGDSMSADLWGGLSRTNPDVNLMQASVSGCKPILGRVGSRRCTEAMHYMFEEYIPRHRVDAILLAARWGLRNVEQVRELARTLRPYAGRIIVFGPHVEYRHDLPWLLAASELTQDPTILDRQRIATQKETDRQFAQQLGKDGTSYVSVYAATCPYGRCQVTDRNGLPLASDFGHLTVSGSIFVATQIERSGALRGTRHGAEHHAASHHGVFPQ